MRLFIGFLIPDDKKYQILTLQSELSNLEIDCKNVENRNLHISMSFLGEVSEIDAKRIESDLDKIADNFKKIKVELQGLKAIPDKKMIRVIALDVKDSGSMLAKLSDEIAQKIGGDVKPPHLTLSRIKSGRNKETLIMFVEKYEHQEFAELEVSAIQLIKSELGRSGQEYSVIHESFLHD